jgi:hypothetical protein
MIKLIRRGMEQNEMNLGDVPITTAFRAGRNLLEAH